jgi:hypothetical protein
MGGGQIQVTEPLHILNFINSRYVEEDRLCGTVVTVPGYRVWGSATLSCKYWVWNGVHSASIG